jgi:hypothetical protein
MVKQATGIIRETIGGPLIVLAALFRVLLLIAAFICIACAVIAGEGLWEGTVFFALSCAMTVGIRFLRQR